MPESPPPTARAVVVGMTDVGRVREHNEDSFLVMNRADGRRGANAERFEVALDGALLLIVCDGMGGAAAGEVASKMAADRMALELGKADFADSAPDQITTLMDHAVQQANIDIHEAAKANPSQKGMGTTMTAAVVTPGRLFVSQVGDSRAYLLRKGLLTQMTKDQSLIGQLIEEGTLTEEEAEKLGGRNIVLQAVGVEENLRVDTKYWPLLRGDVVLLCSDGLSGMVKDAEIKDILIAAGEDVPKAAENLIAEANKNGGRDNVTAIVARFEGEGLRAPMEAAGEGEIEKAGVAFKAPPPPEMPNPMRRMGWIGLAVLLAIGSAALLLRKTTADVTVNVEPHDAAVSIVLTSADGKTYQAVAKNGVATIVDVKPGEQEFDLVASAPGAFDDKKKVSIREAGQVKLEARPIPKPGIVTIESTTTRRVRGTISEPGTHHPKVEVRDQEFQLGDAGKAIQFGNIPSGDVSVVASREGFRDWKQTLKLDPEGTIAFKIPELVPIKCVVTVECDENGAKVEIVDDGGERLDADEVRDGKAKMVNVRAGKQTLRVKRFGFKDFEQDIAVAEGGETKVQVKLEKIKPQVTIVGPPDAEYELYLLKFDGPEKTNEAGSLSREGKSIKLSLEPGNYEIRWRVGPDVRPPVPLPVRVGDQPREVPLK